MMYCHLYDVVDLKKHHENSDEVPEGNLHKSCIDTQIM